MNAVNRIKLIALRTLSSPCSCYRADITFFSTISKIQTGPVVLLIQRGVASPGFMAGTVRSGHRQAPP